MTTNSQDSVNELDGLIQEIGDICHQKYLGSFKRDDRYDDNMYAYEDEVINLLDTPEVRAALNAYISKELAEVIGEDEPEYSNLNGNAGYWEVHGRNKLRAEQRAKAKGYDV